MRSIFEKIYRTNSWNGKESRSGPGSDMEATAALREFLPKFMEEMKLSSILDAPCGEANWMPELPGYHGVDIVRKAIEKACRNQPHGMFKIGDMSTVQLPEVDFIFSRDGMQHLPLATCIRTIQNFRNSSAKFLMASTFVGGKNKDIRAGKYFEPDLQQEPFSLGEPVPSSSVGVARMVGASGGKAAAYSCPPMMNSPEPGTRS